MKNAILLFSILIAAIPLSSTAQSGSKINLCYIKGKVEFTTDNKQWKSLYKMSKTLGEKEILSVGENSSVGIIYKNKYLLFTEKGIYKFNELSVLLDKKVLPFNEGLNPKYQFIITNFIEYYKNPDLYFSASNINTKGKLNSSVMISPVDSELFLSNPEMFFWSKGDKNEYTLMIMDNFENAPLVEITTKDTFAEVKYDFIKDHMYYWIINYKKNQIGFFNTFMVAGDKKYEAIKNELEKINSIPKIDEPNKIMIQSICYEDNKCYCEIDKIFLPALTHNDLKLYYGLYLKRRGLHKEAEKYLK